MAVKKQYQIVGRYMRGTSAIAYHLQNVESGEDGKYFRGQVCFLVGKGQLVNCTGQVYKNGLILRGVGVNLDELPVIGVENEIVRNKPVFATKDDENTIEGTVTKEENLSRILNKYFLDKVVKNGTKTVGYMIRSLGGQRKVINRSEMEKLVLNSRVDGVGYRDYKGKIILRGKGFNMKEIPTVQYSKLKENKTSNEIQEAQVYAN